MRLLLAAAVLGGCSDASQLPSSGTAPRERLTRDVAVATTDSTALTSGTGSGCLQPENGNVSEGSAVTAAACNAGAAAHGYTVPAVGAVGAVSVAGGSLCLDAFGWASEGARVGLWRCHGETNQQWVLTSAGELRSVVGLCATLGSAGAGAPVTLQACVGTPDQRWTTSSNAPAPPPPVGVAPVTGTPIYPGDDIQAKVRAAPVGTRFIIKAGVHLRQTITPKSGMTFVGEPGAVLDGENVTPYAFETLVSLPRNVTITGLVITRYAPPYQRAAIQGDNGTGWVIADNEISYNAYEGVHPGRHGQVLRNYVHHNTVGGISGYKSDSTLIEGNEVAFNGTTMLNEDPSRAEAAGMKFLRQYGLTIRDNNVHDNKVGIWMDTGYQGTLIEGNTVVGNLSAGIWIEATYGAVVRNNRAERNGGTTTGGWLAHAGIQVSNSPNVEIYGNVVAHNMNGIGVMETSGYPVGPYGPLHVENLFVHDNVITMTTGVTGLSENVGDPSVYTSRNNRFVDNTYFLGANAGYFAWAGRSRIDEWAWNGYGQDVTGSFSR